MSNLLPLLCLTVTLAYLTDVHLEVYRIQKTEKKNNYVINLEYGKSYALKHTHGAGCTKELTTSNDHLECIKPAVLYCLSCVA